MLVRIRKYKYLFLILLTTLIFFFPVLKGEVPFPGDLLAHFYEPYRAYPLGGYAPGSVPSKDQGADVVRHIFPWKSLAVDLVKEGQIPFWNPYNFSGNPLMANFQSAVFYPGSIVFYLFPFLVAWTVYIVGSPFLAAVFMFLFLREIKVSRISSFFGGITFAFCSYMVVWMEYGNIDHAFLWLPLGLYFTEKIIKGESIKNNLYLIFALFVSILAGYIQGYFYINCVIVFYYLTKSILNKSFSLKGVSVFLATLIFPFLLSLFQILPTNDLFANSTRSSYTLSQIQHLLNPWWYAITAIAPNFFGNPASHNHWFYGTYIERVSYIGLIPLILFLYAVFNYKKKKEIIIFAIVSIFVFLITLDLFVTKFIYLIPISLISTTVPTRMLSVFQFCAVVLSAIGLDLFIGKKEKKSLTASVIFVGVIIAICWFAAFTNIVHIGSVDLSVAKRNLLLPTAFYISFLILTFAYFRKIKFALFLIIVFTFFDLFYFFNKITPFSPKEFVYPQTPIVYFLQRNAGINRFWGYGSGYIESNFQTYDKTFSPEGVDPIHILRYTRLLESGKEGVIAKELPRPDANIPAGYGETDLRDNIYRQRLLDLLGVKYVLHKKEGSYPDNIIFPEGIYNFVYSDGYFQAYENKEVLPRIFLAGNFTVETDPQKIVDKIFDPQFDLHKTLILEEKPSMRFNTDPHAVVSLENYSANGIRISTSAKENMLLFLSDNYSPQWSVKIDGEKSYIYRADFAFRAVSVPAGKHFIEFYYEDETFYKGLTISAINLLILIFIFAIYKRHEKK